MVENIHINELYLFVMFEKPWYVYCSFAALAIAAMVLVRAISNRLPGKRPPIFEEIPFIGGLVGFIKSPIELGMRGYDAVGEVRAMSKETDTRRSMLTLFVQQIIHSPQYTML